MRADRGNGINRRSLIVKGLAAGGVVAAGGAATLLSGVDKGDAAAPCARREAAFVTSYWSMAPTPTGRRGLR